MQTWRVVVMASAVAVLSAGRASADEQCMYGGTFYGPAPGEEAQPGVVQPPIGND